MMIRLPAWGLCKRLFSGAFAGNVSFREGIPSLHKFHSPDPNHTTSHTLNCWRTGCIIPLKWARISKESFASQAWRGFAEVLALIWYNPFEIELPQVALHIHHHHSSPPPPPKSIRYTSPIDVIKVHGCKVKSGNEKLDSNKSSRVIAQLKSNPRRCSNPSLWGS